MNIELLTEVADHHAEELSELMNQLVPEGVVLTKKDLEQIVRSDSSLLFVAKDGDAIIGSFTLVVYRIPTGSKAIVEDVVVDQSRRRQHIGENMIRYAINYAKEHGIVKIDLTSRPEKAAANRLYQKLGFVKRQTNVYRYDLS